MCVFVYACVLVQCAYVCGLAQCVCACVCMCVCMCVCVLVQCSHVSMQAKRALSHCYQNLQNLSKQSNDLKFSVSIFRFIRSNCFYSDKEYVLKASCQYDPYFSRTKHFCRTLLVHWLEHWSVWYDILSIQMWVGSMYVCVYCMYVLWI